MIRCLAMIRLSSILKLTVFLSSREGIMEFPEDVLAIIRAFSRPLMRFSGEFRQLLIDLGLRDWPRVRAKLCTPDAEQLIVLLRSYKNVYLESMVRLKDMTRPMYPRLMSSSRTEHVKCIQLRNSLYEEIIKIVGEEIQPYR
jgi:hypothetical protein